MRTLLLLLLAARVEAATEYRIVIETTGNAFVPPRVIKTLHLTTGTEEVDRALAPELRAVPGFPLKILLIASRRFEGLAPQTETISATVEEIRR